MSPISKAVLVFTLWITAFIFQSPVWNLAELFAILVIIALARIPFASVSIYLKIIVPVMLIFLILFPLLQDGGTVYFRYWVITITSGGVNAGIVGSSRLGVLFFSTIGMLFTTTKERDLVKGLTKAGLPLGLAFLIMMSLRFVSLSMTDLAIIREARRARATPEKENLIQFVKNLVSVIIPLFLTTIRRIQVASNALEVKGFSPDAKRFGRADERLTYSEVFSISLGVAVVVALALLRLWFGFFS
jgi:energy-coupling factor transport system permease protein